MHISHSKERNTSESRVSMLPANIEKLVKNGAKVTIEAGLGAALGISDDQYKKTGAGIEKNKKKLLASGDIVLALRVPDIKEISALKKNSIYIGIWIHSCRSHCSPFWRRKIFPPLQWK